MKNKNLLEHNVLEFVYALRDGELTMGDIVHFIDYYGVHKFFVKLKGVVLDSEYVGISYNYHLTKKYFEEH